MYLRGMEPGDIDRMYALDVLCFQPPFRFSRAAMRRFASTRNALIRIAGEPVTPSGEAPGREDVHPAEDQFLGFCIVHLQRVDGVLAGYVVTLDIDPHYRKQGLATSLMESLQASAVQAGAVFMALHVSVDNAPAIRLYERLGYECTESVPNLYGPGFDALLYQRPLGPGS